MSSIPLQIQTPQFQSPLQSVGQLLQARDLASQIALRQQQTNQAQQQAADLEQQAQQRRRDLADQNAIQQMMSNPAVSAKVHTGDFSDLEGNVQPKTLDIVRKNQLEYSKGLLANTKEQNELHYSALGHINDALTGLSQMKDANGQPDLAAINAALPSTLQNLAQAGAFKEAGIDPSRIPSTISDPKQLMNYQAQIGGSMAARSQVIAQQEAQGKATEAGAKGQVAQQKAELQKQAIDQFKANPQAGTQIIDRVLPQATDQAANSAYKAAYQSAMATGGPDAAQKIVEAAAAHAGAISKATNPAIMQADVNKAVATEQATAPIKQANAIAEAKALRQGDNPAVAGVPPAAVAAVQNHAIKLDEDYLKAKATSETLGHIIDLTESGNKEAGSNLPLVGVETLNAINGIKRINGAEVSQYGNAGSLLDQIKGKLGKITEGKPIPQDVLNDIRDLHQTLAQQSYQAYTSSLKSLNDRTGAKFVPAADAPNLARGNGGHKIGDTVKLRNGSTVKITAIHPDGSFDAQ